MKSYRSLLVTVLLLVISNLSLIWATLYELVSSSSKPTKDPIRTYESKFEQQCISICARWDDCRAYAFTHSTVNGNSLIRCDFYDAIISLQDLQRVDGVRFFMEKNLDCKDLYDRGARQSGVYMVNLMGRQKKAVRCNMDVEDGGWLVFTRRTSQKIENFNRLWNEYKNGFGNMETEFWLGNDLLHELTKWKPHQVFVWGIGMNGQEGISMHRDFKVGSEDDGYRLTYDRSYIGLKSFEKPGILDKSHYNMLFTTPDRDQDPYTTTHCGEREESGFWYSHCGPLKLFRPTGIIWSGFQTGSTIKEVQIMIKRQD
ncbi:ficolin-1-like [Clytia hemisphaerica]|uniref:Fibrinogen C-terminal domain-containing protein n=1 Tax=Clytia hemisphaerica TaxID=252671 RepID=A0A7M5XBG1_9CNID